MDIPQTAFAAAQQQDFFAVLENLCHNGIGFDIRNNRSRGDAQIGVFPRFPRFLASRAVCAVASADIGGEHKVLEVGNVFVADRINVAAVAAVAAVGAAQRNEFFAPKTRTALSAIARL